MVIIFKDYIIKDFLLTLVINIKLAKTVTHFLTYLF